MDGDDIKESEAPGGGGGGGGTQDAALVVR